MPGARAARKDELAPCWWRGGVYLVYIIINKKPPHPSFFMELVLKKSIQYIRSILFECTATGAGELCGSDLVEALAIAAVVARPRAQCGTDNPKQTIPGTDRLVRGSFVERVSFTMHTPPRVGPGYAQCGEARRTESWCLCQSTQRAKGTPTSSAPGSLPCST